MNGAYIKRNDNKVKDHRLRGYIKKIFENHYFSNHWVFAESLENKLNSITGRKHNITYMNSSVALISMLYIIGLRNRDSVLVTKGVYLFPWVRSCLNYIGLNHSLLDTSAKYDTTDVVISLDVGLVDEKKAIDKITNKIIIPLDLYNKNQEYGDCAHIYDMGPETCFGMSTGAFVAVNNKDHADKLRWMRSSYARTGDVSVYINGNGRFSEIQAAEALVAIRNNQFKKSIFSNINKEIMPLIDAGGYQINYVGSNYTSGIVRVLNPDHKILNKFHSLSNNNGLLYDVYHHDNNQSYALIRVPVDAAVRKSLIRSLS